MYSPDVHYLVCKEISNELRRDAAHYQLVRAAMSQRPNNGKTHWKLAGQIGARLVKWGLKLHVMPTASTRP